MAEFSKRPPRRQTRLDQPGIAQDAPFVTFGAPGTHRLATGREVVQRQLLRCRQRGDLAGQVVKCNPAVQPLLEQCDLFAQIHSASDVDIYIIIAEMEIVKPNEFSYTIRKAKFMEEDNGTTHHS